MTEPGKLEQQILIKHDQVRYRNETIQACKFAAKALSRVPSEEAVAYKKWIMAIGQKVAEAAEEHSVAVSDPEKIALNEIKTALGL